MDWSNEKIQAFRQVLLAWYDAEGRQLPWRQDTNPYHVLVSEIMLQQTQVNTVISYYERFMAALPRVEDLAIVPEDDLFKLWEGLGYYSRARNLKRAAEQVVADGWPTNAKDLKSLAGVGDYTAGAIASISYGEVEPAIDGNAFRVFSRLFEISADITKPKSRQVFDDVIRTLIDPDRPGDFNQAVMDLGSSYMTAKNSDAAHSPVAAFDASLLHGTVENFPVRTKKPRPVAIPYVALVIESVDGLLLAARNQNEMLAGFYAVPLVTEAELLGEDDGPLSDEALIQRAHDWLMTSVGIEAHFEVLPGKPLTQTYTHQKWFVKVLRATIDGHTNLAYYPGKFYNAKDQVALPVPKIQQKINQRLEKFHLSTKNL